MHDDEHQNPPNYCNCTINCRRKSGVNQEKTLRWTHRSIEQRERLGNWLEKGKRGFVEGSFLTLYASKITVSEPSPVT